LRLLNGADSTSSSLRRSLESTHLNWAPIIASKEKKKSVPSIVWQHFRSFFGLDWLLWSFLTFACFGSPTNQTLS
jgi:hypothetical protein